MLNIKSFYFVGFFFLINVDVFPQDFLYTGWFLGGGAMVSSNEYSCIIREKLQPYHINAIKKNGISNEYHVEGKDTMLFIEYSKEGLMTRVGSTSSGQGGEWSEKYVYDEKNRLISINDFLYLTRDASGKITGGSEYGNPFTYLYKNTSLYEVTGLLNDKRDFIREMSYRNGYVCNEIFTFRKKGLRFMLKEGTRDQYCIAEVVTDLQGRTFEYFLWEAGSNSNFDQYGRLKSINSGGIIGKHKTTITYQGNLMTKIQSFSTSLEGTQNSIICIIKYEFVHKAKK